MVISGIRDLLAGRWALGVIATLTLVSATSAEEEYAVPSLLATESLLLDVARVGDRIIAVGERGHVVLSKNRGEDWYQAESVPTRATLTSVFFVNEREGWAVGHDAVVLHTTDAGENWELQHAAPDDEAPLLSVWFEDETHGMAVGAFGLMVETRDGGGSWKRRSLSQSEEEDYHLNEIFHGPEGSVFIAAEVGNVYRSRDKGVTFERLRLGYEGSFWSGLDLGDGSLLVFGMRGHVFRSDDLGENWSEVPTGSEQSLQAGVFVGGKRVTIVGLGGVILTSLDLGESFTVAIQPDRRGIAAVAVGRNERILLFGQGGVKEPEVALP
jgi:photosystem II stability/assembly factor-like uncharacterized protein